MLDFMKKDSLDSAKARLEAARKKVQDGHLELEALSKKQRDNLNTLEQLERDFQKLVKGV